MVAGARKVYYQCKADSANNKPCNWADNIPVKTKSLTALFYYLKLAIGQINQQMIQLTYWAQVYAQPFTS